MKTFWERFLKVLEKSVTVKGLRITVRTLLIIAGSVTVIGGTAYGMRQAFSASTHTVSTAVESQATPEDITPKEQESPPQNVEAQHPSPSNEENASKTATEEGLEKYMEDEAENVHLHVYKEATLRESTCSAEGLKLYTCSVCGYSYEAPVPVLPHQPGDWQILEEATSTKDGLRVRICTECGAVIEKEVIPVIPCSHNYVLAGNTNADCESDGEKTWKCSICGSFYSEIIPATGHDYNFYYIEEGTCEKEGAVYSKCQHCGKVVQSGTVSGKNHSFGEYTVIRGADDCTADKTEERTCRYCGRKESRTIKGYAHTAGNTVEEKAPTCTKAGTGKYICSLCGKEYTAVIPATGHTDGAWKVDREAVCAENGEKHQECSVCGETIAVKAIPALSHLYEETERKDSTCSEKGNILYTCSRCGDTYEKAVEVKDHTPGKWVTETAPTCTKEGAEVRTCSICGAHLKETRLVNKLPHTYEKDNKEAACTEDGYTRKKCSVCGEITDEEAVPALGHDWKGGSDTEATCTEDGYHDDGVCARCGEDAERETIPALGHDYKWVTTKTPTCSEKGEQAYTCTRCGDVEQTAAIEMTAHPYGNWKITTPATEEAKGQEERTCSACGTKDTREIPKLPHIHNYDTRVDDECVKVACETDGLEVFVCRCGEKLEETVPATGHNYQMVSRTEPLCEMDGSEVYECQNEGCDASYSSILSQTGHNPGGWVVIKEATDLEEGIKTQSCQTCGQELGRDTIEKLEHICKFDTLIEEQAATCTTDGFTVYQCRCGKTERNIVPRTNHAKRTWRTAKEASYTETGLKEEVCDDCHAVVNTETIPVIPHEHQYETVEEKAPTCTEDGYTVTRCTFCGASKSVTLNALGHKEGGMEITKAATCMENGEQVSHCSNCGILMKTETIPATGHSAGGWIVDSEAGCESDGSKHIECDVCHMELERNTIPAKGHQMGGWATDSGAGCESDGSESNTCSACGHKETRSIPATGHNYGDWIVDEEPTEETEGSRHKECANCGNTITEDIDPIPPHVHSYSETGREESTCTKAGSIAYTCDGCGNTYSEPLPVIEHTPGEWSVSVQATEETEGKEVRTCTQCGTETDSRVIEKLPHTHNYVVEEKAPTCTENGFKKQSCSCGSVIEEVLPATGHQFGEAEVSDATCVKAGSSTKTCSACGHQEKTDIPMIDHQYIETSRTEATCTESGKITYTCNGCKDTKEEAIAAKGHSYSVTSDVAATCTADGYKLETCANCGDVQKTATDTKLGHDYTQEVVTKEPALGVDGEKEVRCTNCGDVKETQKIDMLLTDGTDSVYTVTVKGGGKEILIGHMEDSMARDIFEKVNAHRVANGKNALVDGKILETYAEKRAYEIAHTFDHIHPNGSGLSGMSGENIAGGATSIDPSDPATRIFEAFKNSSGHNQNMLDDSYNYTRVKVFALKNKAAGIYTYYSYYCVQVFTR